MMLLSPIYQSRFQTLEKITSIDDQPRFQEPVWRFEYESQNLGATRNFRKLLSENSSEQIS